MTNSEIDQRLKALTMAIGEMGNRLIKNCPTSPTRLEGELELMNMSLMGIYSILGEIAKRLPMAGNDQ